MKTLFVFLLSLLLSPNNVLVGSGTAFMKCKCESGRTVFTAELQDIDGLLEKAELSIDGSKLQFSSKDNATIVFDPTCGVFTIHLVGKESKDFPNGRFLKFWVIPKTFKVIKIDGSLEKYEFKARIEATEPRKGKELQIPRVEVFCSLEYKT
jgi:hypothetical protein